MVEVNANLQYVIGGTPTDLEGVADTESATGEALPVIDGKLRTDLATAVTRLTSILAAVDGLEGNTTDLATQTTLAAILTELGDKLDTGGEVALNAATLSALETTTVNQGTAHASETWGVKDDYSSGECLAEQTGAGAVLTFTFSADVHMVHVEADGADTDIARVDPFGGTPTATLGFRASDGVGIYLPVTTSSVKVFAPSGMVVTVNGFRR